MYLKPDPCYSEVWVSRLHQQFPHRTLEIPWGLCLLMEAVLFFKARWVCDQRKWWPLWLFFCTLSLAEFSFDLRRLSFLPQLKLLME